MQLTYFLELFDIKKNYGFYFDKTNPKFMYGKSVGIGKFLLRRRVFVLL